MSKIKPVRFIDGFSESLWASLAVKAVRIGWPAGLRAAAQHLPPSRMKTVLTVQIFEDIFPARGELPAVLDEVKRLDYDALCRRQTHHGRPGVTAAMDTTFDAWEAARGRYKDQGRLCREAQALGFWLTARAMGDFHCWLELRAEELAPPRDLDLTPWSGVPEAVADLHTHEGKVLGLGETLLSGTGPGHLGIARMVQEDGGWRRVRELTHAKHLELDAAGPSDPVQGELFG